MSRIGKLILLISLFVVLGGGYIVTTNIKKNQEEQKKIGSSSQTEVITVSQIDKEKIKTIKIASDKKTIEFYKNDENWTIKGYEKVDLDKSHIIDVEKCFTNLTAERLLVENATEEDKKNYGLDKPQLKAIGKLKDGTEEILLLGGNSPDNSYSYIMKEDSHNIYIVTEHTANLLKSSIDDFRVKKLKNIEPTMLTNIKLIYKDKKNIELKKEESNSDIENQIINTIFQIQPYEIKRQVDLYQYDELIKKIPQFKIDKFIEDDTKDLAKYGLDQPRLEIYLASTDPETKKITSVHYQFGNDLDHEYVYFKSVESSNVYAMNNAFLQDYLNLDPFTLTNKLIYIAKIDLVNTVEIEGLGKKYKLDIDRQLINSEENKKETKETYMIQGKTIEESEFRKIYLDIISVSADFQIKDKSAIELNEEKAIKINYLFTDQSQKEIKYYPYKSNFYLVQIDKDTYFAVENSQIENILKNIENKL